MIDRLRPALPVLLIVACGVAGAEVARYFDGFLPPQSHEQAFANFTGLCFLLVAVFSFVTGFRTSSRAFGGEPRQARVNCFVMALNGASVALILLVLAQLEPCGSIPRAPAVLCVSVGTIVLVASGRYVWRHLPLDMRQQSLAAASKSSTIGVPALIIWVTGDKLGYAVAFTPLSLLAALFALSYVTSTAEGLRNIRSKGEPNP